MLSRIVSTVMWVGKATVFVVGLAVILAVVFGLAFPSEAHRKPKGVLHLGHANSAKALTTLRGSLGGPVLALTNDGTGPALELQVDSGAPLAVNSRTLVANLNADFLDGRSASSFLASNTYRLGQGQERQGNPEAGGKVLQQSCLAGDRLLAGGAASVNAASHVLDSFAANTTTWQVRINDSAVSGGDMFTVVVLCADQ